ncbi:cobalt-precorrin-4 C(11)-methyltransferase [Saccharothrix sp. ALI-22-I]|uniref:cobalt-precorrin-4/precorrin-4 C(11)-methyltransferase n=1 Tax=Saccharothrix sp. ALI-22-I TaxID=1933778 RepID=UPI00097C4E62|nr:cobalt-precorrin-4/precorrin-4 C(11)-methyltransferase [Saccharothrix sp. ALI-22-I]ONI88388.1 cobalt-precorrin-4 C(11)-methyltransferase [Saccharothrix sp. ALI-22-I]
MTGRVSFVGAGPGAADLITVRGAKRIAEADVVLWAPSVVEAECVREHARPDAELVDFSRVAESDVVEVYRRASAGKLKVVRLLAGDPALWGGLRDQQDACQRLGLETDVVPGVSQLSAAAASVGRELTTSDVAQSLLLVGPETAEHVREFAAHGTTMAISASAARTGLLVDQLRAGGYADDTPIVVAYKVSLPDETIAQTTLGELEACVKEHKLYRTTLFLVGKVLAQPASRRRSPVVEGDEPVRRVARPSKWSKRASRPVVKSVSGTESAVAKSPSHAAWSAVHDWQETARTKRTAQPKPKVEPVAEPVLELVADVVVEAAVPVEGERPVEPAPAEAETKPKPKPVVAAAAKRKPTTVQASTTPRRPAAARTKKNKRVN